MNLFLEHHTAIAALAVVMFSIRQSKEKRSGKL